MTDYVLSQQTRDKLMGVATPTIATALFKRGLRNQFIQDVHPLRHKGHNMVGPAYTLRYIPAREDLNPITVFQNRAHPQRRAIGGRERQQDVAVGAVGRALPRERQRRDDPVQLAAERGEGVEALGLADDVALDLQALVVRRGRPDVQRPDLERTGVRPGQVQAAVIEFGGFMGIGTRKIAVEWAALRFEGEAKQPAVILEMKHGVPTRAATRPSTTTMIAGPATRTSCA